MSKLKTRNEVINELLFEISDAEWAGKSLIAQTCRNDISSLAEIDRLNRVIEGLRLQLFIVGRR